MTLIFNNEKNVPFVIVESPFKGRSPDIRELASAPLREIKGTEAYNIRYARACLRDSILRGEAPFASHLLYTQEGVLNDGVESEREFGMSLGWHVMQRADKVCVYTDLGWSSGMMRGFDAAIAEGVEVEIRRLGGEWSTFTPWVDYGTTYWPESNRFGVAPHEALIGKDIIEVDTRQGYVVCYTPPKGFDPIPKAEIVKSDSFKIVKL